MNERVAVGLQVNMEAEFKVWNVKNFKMKRGISQHISNIPKVTLTGLSNWQGLILNVHHYWYINANLKIYKSSHDFGIFKFDLPNVSVNKK